MDPKAVSHVLMNSNVYEKPEASRYGLGQLLGDGKRSLGNWLSKFNDYRIIGLLVAEGDKHRQQVFISFKLTDGDFSDYYLILQRRIMVSSYHI